MHHADAGLNVDTHLFLLNFGTICNTAFLGAVSGVAERMLFV
jgi:hypothetical protein